MWKGTGYFALQHVSIILFYDYIVINQHKLGNHMLELNRDFTVYM